MISLFFHLQPQFWNYFITWNTSHKFIIVRPKLPSYLWNRANIYASINYSGAHPPWQPRGSRPGDGAVAILSRPRGLGISVPRARPVHLTTRVYERRMSLSGRTRPLSNKSCNFGKTTTTNQCKMVPDLWRPGSVKTGARLWLLVKIKRYRLCKKRQTDPQGEERKRNKTALKLKQLQHIALVLISVLFYFFSSLRRGDQSTVFCIAFVKDWLVRQVLEKLSMFSHF